MKMEMFEEIREIANSKIPADLRLHQAAVQVLAYSAGITKRLPEMEGSRMDSKGWLWIGKGAGIRVRAAKGGQAVEIQTHYDLSKIAGGVEGCQGLATFVPLAWLGKRGWTAVHRQVSLMAADDRGQYTLRVESDVPYIVKAVTVWGHSDTREMFLKCMQNRALMFNIKTDDGFFGVAPYHYTQNTGFVRAEQNIKGLKGAGWPSTAAAFNVIREDDGLWLFEDPSKTNERVTKIYWNTDGLAIGTWNMMVAIDQIMVDGNHKDAVELQNEIDNAFCTGTAYSKGLFRFAGAGRFVTRRLGCKMTVCSPFQLDGIMDDTILVNKSVAKGGLNMLLAHLGILSQEEQVKMFDGLSGKEVAAIAIQMLTNAGKIRTIKAKYRGVDVTFSAVCTQEVVYATNLYTLYGCQYADDNTEMDDYEETSLASSYYLNKQKELVDNSSYELRSRYQLAGVVMNDIANGVVVKKAPKTSFSIREMTNFFWSYCVLEKDGKMVVDTKPLHGLVQQLLDENARTENATQREMHRIMRDGYAGLPRLSLEQFRAVLDEIFTVKSMTAVPGFEDEEETSAIQIPMSGWMRSQSGLGNLTDEQFCYKWKQLVSKGSKNGSIPFWPGLGGKGFVVEAGGHDMFVPGAAFLKKDIMPVDKATYDKDTNPECMFGESMQTIMSLFMAARSSRTMEGFEWGFTSAQHLVRMNSAMFEDRLNRMSVAGTYLTMAPRFWDVKAGHQYRITSFLAPAGKICYSKDPVLFDKAVTGVVNKQGLPHKVFGAITPVDIFAMKSVAFVDTDLMLQQENDTDGDLCCIRFHLDVPLYTEQWRYMDLRVQTYVKDEREFVMGGKPWKKYSFDELANGVDGNKQAKENIGLMSSNLFQHAMLLENAVLNAGMSLFWAKLFWNMYGYIVQYEAMRQIKHADGGGGQSQYYASTSVAMVLKGKVDTITDGFPEEEGGDGGFWNNISSHYSGWQATDANHKLLRAAVHSYCVASVGFNFNAYGSDEKFPIGGNRTGRTAGIMKMESIPLAIDINTGKCAVHQYRWFSALSRGYYRHVEENRLGVARANSGLKQLEKHGVRAPKNGLDIFFGHMKVAKELAYENVFFNPVELLSAAYRLDARVRNGWRSQHTFAGANNCVTTNSAVMAIRWMDMVSNAPDAAEKMLWKRAFKCITTELISSQAIVVDPVQSAIDGLGKLPENIVYPGEKKGS